MSGFDDKRFIQNDGTHCLPFGLSEIRNWQVHSEIGEDDDSGGQEREETSESSPTWSTLIRVFRVSPGSKVQSLSKYFADVERRSHVVQTQVSTEIFTPAEAVMHRDYSESELEKSLTSMKNQRHIQVLEKQTLSVTTKLKEIPLETSIQTMTM